MGPQEMDNRLYIVADDSTVACENVYYNICVPVKLSQTECGMAHQLLPPVSI